MTVLIPYDCVLTRRGNLGTDRHTECHVNMKAETGVMPLHAREHLIVRKTSEASGERLGTFFLTLLRRSQHC